VQADGGRPADYRSRRREMSKSPRPLFYGGLFAHEIGGFYNSGCHDLIYRENVYAEAVRRAPENQQLIATRDELL
jgi:hypothetical protein